MTDVRLSDDRSIINRADILIVPVHASSDSVELASLAQFKGTVWETRVLPLLRRDRLFAGEAGQVSALVLASEPENGPALLAIGAGARDEIDANSIRTIAFAAARASRGRGHCVFMLDGLGGDSAAVIRAATEGVLLGRYDYAGAGEEMSVTLLASHGAEGKERVERAFAIGLAAARNANWVRRLVETPGGNLSPAVFAEIIADRARGLGIAVEIWDKAAMAAKGFGGTAAVGSGSNNAPVVVQLKTRTGKTRLGLAGKGITFDSGGINLKRNPEEIVWMKADMAAAAAVAGAVFAAVELGADPDVTVILPMAENMPSGHALRPGDVISHPGGRRTEVTDTDCEGRLILADAVAYLAGSGVGEIIDVGTLTDGGGVGPLLWGCWATSDSLAAALTSAGETAGEPGWRLPLRPEYARVLASKVADIANASFTQPDSGQIAATYLRSFAGTVPWVHIDNGSSAYLEHDLSPWPSGATGSPLRALLQLLLDRAQA